VPYGTRAPKELQHHLPTLVLCRPSVSARPPGTPTGVRGSRMRDRRPPAYRCPAVPGLASSARAILMALDSSVLPSRSITCERELRTACTADTANCWWPYAAPPSGGRPRRPSCVCSGREPHCRISPARVRSPTPSPGVPLNTALLVLQPRQLRSCVWRPLATAGRPVRPSVPSPSYDNLASKLHHRTVLRVLLPGSSCLPGLD